MAPDVATRSYGYSVVTSESGRSVIVITIDREPYVTIPSLAGRAEIVGM